MSTLFLRSGQQLVVQEDRQEVLDRIAGGKATGDPVAELTVMGPSASGFRSDPWEPRGAVSVFIEHVEAVRD